MVGMMRSLALGLLERASPRGFAAVAGVVGTVAAVPGALDTFGVIDSPAFDLNGERNVPTVVTTLLLLTASAAALAHWFATDGGEMGRWERRTNLFVMALFGYMAADEFGQLHEKAEHVSGIDWQTLFLPVFVAAAAAVVVVLRAWRGRPVARTLLVTGSVVWFLSQVAEHLEYDSHDVEVEGFQYYVLFEEVLELVGTTLFVSAFIHAGRWALRRRIERHTAVVSAPVSP